ncbi:MAG TPA: sigma-70 family RNA polymerase sigma factor [Vicinamibacterales bacterium]|nr:sigma-70 family RNA polymerase sigma factor [Vicinamibacterales bacterium]
MDATEAAAVLARARQGDSDAFRALVEKHSRSVFHLAFRMTGNEQDAEDVVQESFLRAYRQLGRFESRANFGTWLYRIVANCSVDLMRSKQARHDQVRGDSLDAGAMELPAVNVPGPERMAESAEIERRVQDALQELSPLERAAFTLRHYEGRSIDEISSTLGLGTSAAKHSVFRAVKKLRLALAPLRSQES